MTVTERAKLAEEKLRKNSKTWFKWFKSSWPLQSTQCKVSHQCWALCGDEALKASYKQARGHDCMWVGYMEGVEQRKGKNAIF